MRITRQNTGLLVVDVQNRLFPVMWNKDKFLNNCQLLIQGMMELQLPVEYTQQYTKGLGDTIDEIRGLSSDFSFIEKREFSCCDEPAVIDRLKDLNLRNVLLCGIEAHVCVLQTAIDLRENGYNPVIVADCITSRQPESIDIAKERFRYENIMMTTAESILFELTRTSAAPEFKAISALVKNA